MAWLHSKASYYNAIYGVVYHLLFFTLWLYWSWLIVLFGNEVAYARQNLKALTEQFRRPAPREPVDEYLALAALVAISERYLHRETLLSLDELARTLGSGDLSASRVVGALKDLELVLELSAVSPATDSPRYVPAMPLDQVTVGHVLKILRQARVGAVIQVVAEEPGLSSLLRRLAEGPGTSPWDTLSLKDLVLQASTAAG
jgi:hypothetical protein